MPSTAPERALSLSVQLRIERLLQPDDSVGEWLGK